MGCIAESFELFPDGQEYKLVAIHSIGLTVPDRNTLKLPSLGTPIQHYRCGKDQLVCQVYKCICICTESCRINLQLPAGLSIVGYNKFTAAGLSSQLGSHPVHPNQKCLRLLSKAIANYFHLNGKRCMLSLDTSSYSSKYV